ncbi:S-adenosyl-L-methionine-dependent methyltransferase [Aspergillus ambiguus]|uniref:S-adenosyl-L-methionine-dependent methyltransferase n=1 Tax=Aspergillus ambiguus TaxID=176160 RepID=UPI003CCDF9B4
MTSPDSQTEELDEKYTRIARIHGRQYQKFSIDNRISFEPVDEEEADRLEIQHQVLNRVFDNRLIFPPVPRLQRILDCGYGAGSWAVDAAERYPDCEVTGVDISPHMNPGDTPENLWLQVDDLNHPFTFPSNHFDLVNSRLVATGINRTRWPGYIRDIKRVLRPGGWVQLVEIYFNVQSDNGSITERNALRQWSAHYLGCLGEAKDLRVGTRLRNLLIAGGLTEVDARMIPLPFSAWSNDPRMREIGMMNRDNIQSLLSSMALYPFTHRLRMGIDQFESLMARARREADTPNLKAYFPLYVCIGRKGR